MRKVATADGEELRLHASGFYVRFTLDRNARTITIWAVRRVPSKQVPGGAGVARRSRPV